MMLFIEENVHWIWVLLGLGLILLEIAVGTFILLPLGIAALGVAIVSVAGGSLSIQLLALATLAGILLPISIRWIRPFFSPKGVGYGTTGTGAEKGRVFYLVRRDFDDAIGIRIKGDFFRASIDGQEPGKELRENLAVSFIRFDGTLAIVQPVEAQPTQDTTTPNAPENAS